MVVFSFEADAVLPISNSTKLMNSALWNQAPRTETCTEELEAGNKHPIRFLQVSISNAVLGGSNILFRIIVRRCDHSRKPLTDNTIPVALDLHSMKVGVHELLIHEKQPELLYNLAPEMAHNII